MDINLNECQTNEECKDNKFYTKDICSGNEIKLCSNKINYTLVFLIGIVVIVILIILLFLLFRKKSS